MPPAVQEEEVFEERAENLPADRFREWTQTSSFEQQVLRQLTAPGPRLLSGPRGCGKSTLLRLAAERMRESGHDVPIYVNYGKSMFIEPAFKQRSDADGFFQDWLVARIVTAASTELAFHEGSSLSELARRCEEFTRSAEVDALTPRLGLPGPTALAELLLEWARSHARKRVVLLLDDAAHAFVPEQQRVFFEFLRNIRSPGVTYKAAIYPGVTEFSPNFHVGHDAKIVRAWVAVEGRDYLDFMRSIFHARFPDKLRSRISDDLVDFFAGAAFGIPRAFISMVEAYSDSVPANPGRIAGVANTVVAEHAQQLLKLYGSLARKLPAYSRYVEHGMTVQERMVRELAQLNATRFNRNEETDQALDVGVRLPVPKRLATIFSLLEYAGVIRQTFENVSLGEQIAYTKISVHSSLLIAGNALRFGKNPTIGQRAHALVRSSRSRSYKRLMGEALLTKEEAASCTLAVGTCQNCGAERLSEASRFCHVCGTELVDESRFASLLRTTIDALPLTPKKIRSLEAQGFDTVEDIIRDRGHEQIRQARRVGPTWAGRIYSIAEEFVSV